MPEESAATQELQMIMAKITLLEHENRNLALRLENSKLNSRAPTPPAQNHPPAEPKVALPERFNGNKKTIRTFLNQLDLLFMLNPSRYPNDGVKVATAGSLFSGAAASWFNPMLERTADFSELLNDWTSFKQRLREAFGGIDPAVQAESELQMLRQGNNPVHDYTARFLQIAADLNWNEAALIFHYRQGLSEEIKDELSHHDRPASLDQLTALASRIDSRLTERRLERAGSRTNHTVRPRMNFNTQPPNTPAPKMEFPPTEPTAMDVDAVRRAPLTQAEKDRRFHQDLCLYCGHDDHFVSKCPFIPKNSSKGPRRQGNDHRQ